MPKLLADLDDGLGDALDLAVEEVLDFFESQFVADERCDVHLAGFEQADGVFEASGGVYYHPPVLRTTSRQRKEEVSSHGFRRQYSLAAGFPFFFRRPHFSLHHLY